MASTATTDRPNHSLGPATNTVRPLHRPADVASLLGCSEWWVKEQARHRRIPYAWIGGSYRFTNEHIAEIVRRFEVAPLSETPAAPSVSPALKPRPQPAEADVRQLTARPPRRARQNMPDRSVS